jgi:hypothetical protein
MVWVKCTTSAECKPIRIAESSVMDGSKDHYIAQCQVLVLSKCFQKEMEKGAGQSTRRVLPWHGYGLEYLQGTAAGMGWSCVIDLDL